MENVFILFGMRSFEMLLCFGPTDYLNLYYPMFAKQRKEQK